MAGETSVLKAIPVPDTGYEPEPGLAAFRVAIVGAGLGGPALAQMLRKNPRVRVRLYERDVTVTSRLAGYRIQMEPQALERLETVVPAETRAAISASRGTQPPEGQRMGFMRADGRILTTYYPHEFRQMRSVSRWLLRQALLFGASAKSVDGVEEGFMRVGKKLEYYEEDIDGKGTVHLKFADGTTDECDLLVGADGIHSAVRRQLLPHIVVRPSDIGVIYFKVSRTPELRKLFPIGTGCMAFCKRNQSIILHEWVHPGHEWTEGKDPDHIAPDQSFIMLGYGSRLPYFINTSKYPESFTSEELVDEVKKRKDAYEMIPALRTLVDNVILDSAYCNVLKFVDIPKPWDNTRVTLLGDSVFNLSPYTGKGASMAIDDAVDLAYYMGQEGFFDDPVKRQRLMQSYVKGMLARRTTQRRQSMIIQFLAWCGQTVFQRFFRDTVFRLMDFLLNRD